MEMTWAKGASNNDANERVFFLAILVPPSMFSEVTMSNALLMSVWEK